MSRADKEALAFLVVFLVLIVGGVTAVIVGEMDRARNCDRLGGFVANGLCIRGEIIDVRNL